MVRNRIIRINAIEKLQSAMEYLMTYGWSILLVALVLSIIYSSDFFGSQTLAFTCLGQPSFLCMGSTMSSSGALSVVFGYAGSQPITITGLSCNITSEPQPPSSESTYLMVSPNQKMNLTFQCPVKNPAPIGTTIPVFLWFYYNTPTLTGLQQLYARGMVKVDYQSLLWNVVEWTPSSSAVQLLPYSQVSANPERPSGSSLVTNTVWSSFVTGGKTGWSYSTDWHNHDIYYGIQTALFPTNLLSSDTAPCSPPYASHAYTANTYANMGGAYTFTIVTDDATDIFYRQAGGGAWQCVFCNTPQNGNYPWSNQAPTTYTSAVSISPSGKYELVVDYMDTCDPAGLSTVLISPSPSLPS